MTESSQEREPSGDLSGALLTGVQAPDGGTARCSYCGEADPDWTARELRTGWRFNERGQQYHCYTAYCMD